MKAPLPSTITSAIATIRWPLDQPSMPMYYEPISSLRTLRQPTSIPPTLQPLMDIPQVIHDMTLRNGDGDEDNMSQRRHYSTLALALIFLGNGLPDECHNLITPLSWNDDTYFGGPTMITRSTMGISSSSSYGVDENVISLASYAHALPHRREGYAMGEFGMMGYQNANYWANAAVAVAKSATTSTSPLPFQDVRKEVLNIAQEYGNDAMEWCNEKNIKEGDVCYDEDYWDIRALHELCASVSVSNNVHSSTEILKAFAERAAEIELRVLLRNSLERAGYDCGDCLWREDLKNIDADADDANGKTELINTTKKDSTAEEEPNATKCSVQIDESAALSVANKISSSHLGVFESSGSVTLRNVCRSLDPGNDDTDNRDCIISIAAGMACRLLASPAVCYIPSYSNLINKEEEEILQIILPSSELESEQCQLKLTGKSQATNNSSFYGGGPLGVGDAFAFITKGKDAIIDQDRGVYTFLPCVASDEDAIFVDRFHGTRGETPTSVLQWSKGTVHVSEHLKYR